MEEGWMLIEDKGVWDAFIKGLHKGAKTPIELWGDTQPQHFPCLVRTFGSGSTGGVINVCVVAFDNLELAVKFLRLTLQKENKDLALVTFTEGSGPIELSITRNISLLIES